MHITTNTFVNKLHVHTYFFLFKIYIMWCVMCMHNNNVRQCSRKNGVYYVHILTLHFPISIYAILKSTTFYIPSCANLSSHIHTLTHAITHTHTHTTTLKKALLLWKWTTIFNITTIILTTIIFI